MEINDTKYLFESFVGLIKEEMSRIEIQKLANRDDVVKFANGFIINNLKSKNETSAENIINVLAGVHKDLSQIKLPGDFEKLSCLTPESICLILEVPSLEAIKPEKQIEELKPIEILVETKDLEEEPEDKKKKVKSMVIEKLEKIANSLGKNGDHEAAYLVERCASDIEVSAGFDDMFNEMGQMEKQNQQPKAPATNTQSQRTVTPQAQPQAQAPAPAPVRPQQRQLTQEQVAQMTNNMSQEEFNKRKQQAERGVANTWQAQNKLPGQQWRQPGTQPAQAAPQQKPVAPQTQQPAKQPQQTQPQQPQQNNVDRKTMLQLYEAVKQKTGKPINLALFEQNIKRFGPDAIRKKYKI